MFHIVWTFVDILVCAVITIMIIKIAFKGAI